MSDLFIPIKFNPLEFNDNSLESSNLKQRRRPASRNPRTQPVESVLQCPTKDSPPLQKDRAIRLSQSATQQPTPATVCFDRHGPA